VTVYDNQQANSSVTMKLSGRRQVTVGVHRAVFDS